LIANALLTVARIAYLSSDVVVSVQPAIGTDSEFSSHLNRYASRKDSSLVAQSADTVPEVSLLKGNLPLLDALRKISDLLWRTL
jgi:sulfite reductase (NADPH) hemoprotein beta-component